MATAQATVKTVKKAAAIEAQSGDFTMGFVIIPSIGERAIKDVRRAAEAAGFTESVRDVKARNVFIRSTRELRKRNVIEEGSDGALRDKIDDSEYIAFQFSKRYVEEKGATYDRACVIKFHKATGKIECDNSAIKELAEKLMDEVQGVAETHDITAFVHRVVRKDTRRISIGIGSYFLSANWSELVKQLEKFYKALNCPCVVLPVNHSSGQAGEILKHIVEDLKASMTSLSNEIEKLKTDKGLTKRIAANRLKELRGQLKEYRELAGSLHVDLSDLLKAAGEHAKTLVQAAQPLDTLVAAIQKGETLDSVVASLLVADEALTETFAAAHIAPVDLSNVEAVKHEAPVDLFSTVK